MEYKIGELAEKTGLSSHTLRYYEKEGILTGILRDESGRRIYTGKDVETLEIVECMKKSGMSLEFIRENIGYFDHSPENAAKRVEAFEKQRDELREKLRGLQEELEKAEFKIWYYRNIELLDSEAVPGHTKRMKALYEKMTGKKLPESV